MSVDNELNKLTMNNVKKKIYTYTNIFHYTFGILPYAAFTALINFSI